MENIETSEGLIQFGNLVELLRRRSSLTPDRELFTFLKDNGEEQSRLHYRILDEKARSIGSLLQQLEVEGKSILLLYPSGQDFVEAFFGCLYAHAIAVPVLPPRSTRFVSRVQAIVKDTRATIALTLSSILSRLEPLFDHMPELAEVKWVTTDDIGIELAQAWTMPSIDGSDIAFLQYTSGSTSTPRGVMISHANLMHNESVIQKAFQQTSDSIVVGWLPMHHDMGLIGNILQPLYAGAKCVWMPPAAFLKNPLMWLQTISRYKATTSGGPNFAYDLCVRKINPEQLEGLDLSNWQVAFNGAEPVRAETMRRFAEKFESVGFRSNAFYPCYGLAEATLLVTCAASGIKECLIDPLSLAENRVIEAQPDDENPNSLIMCGITPDSQKVVIVSSETHTLCPPDTVGEIWVAGPSVGQGYWNRPDETKQIFDAYITNSDEGPFLRTGDLGFIHEGELVITGRLKDLIIIRGKNYYPQDIETTVEHCHPSLRSGCGAAFSVDFEHEERLVIVHELEYRQHPDASQVFSSIRRSVAERHELQIQSIYLIKPGTMPKTPSGKVQRHLCSRAVSEGSLNIIAEYSANSAVQQNSSATLRSPSNTEEVQFWLAAHLESVLGVQSGNIDIDRPLVDYGLDSLAAVELLHQIESNYGVVIALPDIMDGQTISEIALTVFQNICAADPDLEFSSLVESFHSGPGLLSHGQRALYFLQKSDPSSSAYNIATAIRIKGSLDIDLIRKCFQFLVERHDALRTTFQLADGEPVQEARDCVQVNFEQEDATDYNGEHLDKRLREESNEPFSLEEDSLLRVRLFTRSTDEHILLLVIHHIVADLWSLALMTYELTRLYVTRGEFEETNFDQLPLRYVDYARWHNEKLKSPRGEKLWNYWDSHLSGEVPILKLPADRPRPPRQTYNGVTCSFSLDSNLTLKLKNYSASHRVTAYVTLLTVFQALLHRYTGQETLLVGSPIDGRTRSALSGIVGYFANLLPVRSTLSDDMSFRDFLKQTHCNVRDVLAHQDYPFALLVERLQPERNPAVPPLVQAVFAFQSSPSFSERDFGGFVLGDARSSMRVGDLVLNPYGFERGISLFDLSLTVAETDGALTASLQYNSDIFLPEIINSMLSSFQTLLESVIADDSKPVCQLPLIKHAEKQLLLKRWTDSQGARFSTGLMHEMFEEQVRLNPQAVAVCFEETSLTYDELNRRANRLAHRLSAKGVGADSLVGICLDRSIEMVVAILAVVKSGSAYVPMDPRNPKERLTSTIEEIDSRLVIVHQSEESALQECGADVITVEDELDSAEVANEENLGIKLEPYNLAYVIYTSGSTGKPKGVMVSHGNVARLFSATRSWFHFDQRDVWTLFHSYAFDFSVWELWGALAFGGRLVIVSYNTSRSPHAFRDILRAEGVTILCQTPSAFRNLIHADQSQASADLSKLRLVIFGGEALDYSSLKPWFARYRDQRPQMVNMYGITETTVHVTYRPISRSDLNGQASSLIGDAIPDLQIYILDNNLEPVPTGVPGEIYIGGEGVARGYLKRQSLTAERFIPCPFGDNPGSRLYRSGDLARYKTNGDIEYIGRADHQAKIRGFRIELGEIETAIERHPLIHHAVVLVKEDTSIHGRFRPEEPVIESDPVVMRYSRRYIKEHWIRIEEHLTEKTLSAYLVCDPQNRPDANDLRILLKESLPDYMIPTSFVFLDSLPLTANGKLNQKALLALSSSWNERTETFVAPRNQIERELASIWSEVLGIDQIGIDDNYFALGGDSIRSIRVLSLAARRGFDLTFQNLFEHQSIRELARITEATKTVSEQRDLAPFNMVTEEDKQNLPDGLVDAYPLSRMQGGLIYHSDYASSSTVYQATFLYRIRGLFDIKRFQESVQYIVDRHPIFRTSYNLATFSEPMQLVHPTIQAPFTVEDLRGRTISEQEEAIEIWFELEKGRRFEITRAPLIRFSVLQISDAIFEFGFTCHDSILDGWSTALMITELLRYYDSLLNETHLDLNPSDVSYKHFVELERAAIASDENRKYWETKTANSQMAGIVHRPINSASSSKPMLCVADVTISENLSQKLKDLAVATGVPLKSVLLAAHLRVISLLSGQSDITTGLEINGRLEERGGELAVGQHLNTLPFRQYMKGGTWIELIRETFNTERELLPFRRFPYIEIQKITGGQPLYETTFNYTHFHIFEELQALKWLEVIEGRGRELTHYLIKTEFNQDAVSGRIHLDVICDPSQLSEDLMNAVGRYYLNALEEMTHNPDQRYETATILSQKELDLIVEWNRTSDDSYQEKYVHKLFETWAEKIPASKAVIIDNESINYKELNERANQTARFLRSAGVGPDDRVGVFMNRSIELVVALMGILKAGAAFVPLDPDYPARRLANMLEDAEAKIILTLSDLSNLLPSGKSRIVSMDTEWKLIATKDTTNLAIEILPDNIAYVIFTSGSTGRPKGAANTHKGISNRLLWMQNEFRLTPEDAVLQKTPVSFDVSVWEFFWPLITGARLILARPGGHRDSSYLVDLIAEQRITTLHFVPSMLEVFLDDEGIDRCASIKTVICSGESLSESLQSRFFNSFNAELHNLYGPTEAAIDVTSWKCERNSQRITVPIGRPIWNTQIYILDKHLAPLPAGVAGEIYIGGIGLAREYIGRPDLTAERFIPDPFSEVAGSRLYRTGDLGAFLPDGAIEFLGRIDYQIKIRGRRIETEEIEAILLEHESVKQVAVAAKETSESEKRLTAYIVLNREATPAIDDLRDYLKERLPIYMLPSYFIIMDELPVSPNGKLDRNALPLPDQVESSDERLSRVLERIEHMSEDEVRALLSSELYR